jgi:type II secretory pathway pseudopilin PulG
MGGRKLLVLVLLIAAVPAWGQSEEEITAATEKQLTAYNSCIRAHAKEQAKASTLPPDTIADKAIAACTDERADLSEQLQKPPIGWTPSQAETEIDSALGQLRPQVLETIRLARGG